jgi:hypothetical protein
MNAVAAANIGIKKNGDMKSPLQRIKDGGVKPACSRRVAALQKEPI